MAKATWMAVPPRMLSTALRRHRCRPKVAAADGNQPQQLDLAGGQQPRRFPPRLQAQRLADVRLQQDGGGPVLLAEGAAGPAEEHVLSAGRSAPAPRPSRPDRLTARAQYRG